MANTPRSGRPTADQVDPITPQTPAADPAPDPKADEKALTESGPVLQISDDEIDVKTSGAFMLMDPVTAKHFDNENATTTRQTQFVVENLASGKLVEA